MRQKLTISTAHNSSTAVKRSGNTQGPIMSVRIPCQVLTRDPMSAVRPCVGCGRSFVPTGPQRYCSHECYSGTLRVGISDRFWSKVNKHTASGCWLWTAATIRGYGQISSHVNGKKRPVYAHRLAWELTNGPIENGLFVLHKCDVPLCVNPAHLFLGTQQQNLEDARQKGRLVESLPRTQTLTPEQRLTIFGLPAQRGLNAALARQHGVSKSCISVIRQGRFARSVPLTLEPVRFVRVPVRGVLHVGSLADGSAVHPDNSVAEAVR